MIDAHQDVAGLVSLIEVCKKAASDGRTVLLDPESVLPIAEAAFKSLGEAEAERWQSIDTAPKDGTHILVWFIHANALYSKDPVAEGWACAHEAHWIDHNGGGWTWCGLSGAATYWQPLPKPPARAFIAGNGGKDG